MSPNIARTAVRYVLGIAVVTGVALLTCGCKASGHVDFSIDIPALELETISPGPDPKP